MGVQQLKVFEREHLVGRSTGTDPNLCNQWHTVQNDLPSETLDDLAFPNPEDHNNDVGAGEFQAAFLDFWMRMIAALSELNPDNAIAPEVLEEINQLPTAQQRLVRVM